ncbi:MAG: FAD-dependent oxidoreductase [Planctomycetota bacterium]|nr:MAG: FAD-dependent oxidoreductase [Planctomycetota bacterium]
MHDSLAPVSTLATTDECIAENAFAEEHHRVAVCVVGGGMAGICAALASARAGVPTALIQDRSMLGGNASSEVRMWICGAHGPDFKEGGILEELQLANILHNPGLNYPLWDAVLYDAIRRCEQLKTFLSCSVCRVQMDQGRLAAVRAWHLTRQCWITVEAEQFIDCSGDSVLRASAAAMRRGREGHAEFDESLAPDQADRRTMGNSILLQLRRCDPAQHRPFRAPPWARSIPEDHPRYANLTPTGHNFWWLELGDMADSVADADGIRDELMALALGVWATIKNHPDGRGKAWELEWVGSLPGKRESFRYIGAHTLTEQEVASGGDFPDRIAYGGWSMDDHPPGGFDHRGEPTQFHAAPSPYGIPAGVLYSQSVPNLWCAGRNISATHMALSSTRVMATCAMLGQAAGSGAALAVQQGCDAAAVHRNLLYPWQNRLMDADQWLPGLAKALPALTRSARITSSSSGDVESLRDGIERRLDGHRHALDCQPGDWIELRWDQPQELARLRIVGDSQLHRPKRMPCSRPADDHHEAMPAPLWRRARIELRAESDGPWQVVHEIDDNALRCRIIPLPHRACALRLVLLAGWGDGPIRIQALEVGEPDWQAPPHSVSWPQPFYQHGKPGRGPAA